MDDKKMVDVESKATSKKKQNAYRRMLLEVVRGESLGDEAASVTAEEDREEVLTQLKLKYKEEFDQFERTKIMQGKDGKPVPQWEIDAMAKIDSLPRPFERIVNPNTLDPVFKLEHCDALTVPNDDFPVGSTNLKLKMIKQFPVEFPYTGPKFELAERSQEYEVMENSMTTVYGSFCFKPVLEHTHVKIGTYAVLKCEMPARKGMLSSNASSCTININKHTSTNVSYKRIKFVSAGHGSNASSLYRVEFIDYSTIINIHLNEDVLLLDRRFAKLPPRVCAIEMDGVEYYVEDARLPKILKSELGSKVVTAEILSNGKVVLFSEKVTPSTCVYGINLRIFERIWIENEEEPKLPRKGFKRNDCYVVHAETTGEIAVQFGIAESRHCLDVVNSLGQEEIEKHLGSVTKPQPAEVYLVKFDIDGNFYRAVIPNNAKDICDKGLSPDDTVPVRFVDYGNRMDVKVKELVMGKNVHRLLPFIPKSYCFVKLANIKKILNVEKYMEKFHSNDQVLEVHVVKDAGEETLAEVILRRCNVCIDKGVDGVEYGEEIPQKLSLKKGQQVVRSGRVCINQRMVEEGYAEPIELDFNYNLPSMGYALSKSFG